ncbi:MAG: hypothetical protein KA998_04320 [Rickettsiaceae bacterium]|nr:hypothetical protein [Rickettsiaceae bacterium]
MTIRKILENPESCNLEEMKKIVCDELAKLSHQPKRAMVITKSATKTELISMIETLLSITDNGL